MKKLIFIGFLILAVSLWAGPAKAAQSTQIPLAGAAIPQFAQPLPLLGDLLGSLPGLVGTMHTVAGNGALKIRMCEFQAKVLPPGTNPALPTVQPLTWVWGYLAEPSTGGPYNSCAELVDVYFDGVKNNITGPLDTYIGPVILNDRGSSTDITFINDLPPVGGPLGTKVKAWKYSTDVTLHWADPLNAEANAGADFVKYGAFPGPGSEFALNYGEDPLNPGIFLPDPIPAVVHLHGGEVPPVLDGGPDAWVTSSSGLKGHGYYSAASVANGFIYNYPNSQEAAPIWFHDHVLGITRLNVYAGLAGAYLISEPTLKLPAGLHPYGLSYGTIGAPPQPTLDVPTIPLVIQDRMFDINGDLFFPADSAGGILWAANPQHPYWVPEFVGDTVVVNGKVWPFLNVEAKRYRFLFLNGSNARTYVLSISGKPKMYVIATDGGYLDNPVPINTLTIMPGERYEVIIDFAGKKGNLVMNNSGKTPFPRGAQPQGATVGRVMQFRITPVVKGFVDNSYDPALGTAIRTGAAGEFPKIVRLPGTPQGGPAVVTAPGPTQNVQATRLLTLNEVLLPPQPVLTDPVTGGQVAYPGGPLEALVNNSKWPGKFNTNCRGDFPAKTFPSQSGGDPVTQCYSELPGEGTTEIWEIANLTGDAHPIHLHLVQFQIMDRQNFDVAKYTAVYNASFGIGTPGWATLPPQLNCQAGLYCPGIGPPLPYGPDPATGNKYGGNPDVLPYLKQAAFLPALEEQGWKDTVVAMPGQVTRLAVRWAPMDVAVATTPNLTGAYAFPFNPDGDHGYVWHCHIIDHEDNEMMRPTSVTVLVLATGTATAADPGGTTLTDTTTNANFTAALIGSTVINRVTSATAIITAVTPPNQLTTDLLAGGWAVGDAYDIVPTRTYVKGVDY